MSAYQFVCIVGVEIQLTFCVAVSQECLLAFVVVGQDLECLYIHTM